MESLPCNQLDQQGDIVVPAVAPLENLEAVFTDICQHIGKDLNDLTTWYTPHTERDTGMVEMYHYQSMWNNRQHPRVHQVFTEVFESEELWVKPGSNKFRQ